MSAADPRAIDCSKAMERLYEYLDGELTPERAAQVQAHLDRCADCFALSRFEDTFLRFVEARARARGVPQHVKQEILHRLLQEPDEDTATA